MPFYVDAYVKFYAATMLEVGVVTFDLNIKLNVLKSKGKREGERVIYKIQ